MPIAAPDWDPNARAKQQAGVKYDTAEAQLKRALEQVALDAAANEAGIQKYGDVGRQGINQTFDQLAGNLATNRTRTEADLNTQANQIGRGYRDANQMGEAARAAAQQRLSKLAGVLGYGGENVASASSGLENLAAQITGENAQNDATRTGNLRNWAAQQVALMREGEGNAERDRSNRLGGFETELFQALAKNKNTAFNQKFDLNASLLDMLTERGAFQANAANELMDQLFGQQLQASQFNLAEADAASQAADRAASRSQASAELSWKQQLAEKEFAKAVADGDWAKAQAIQERQDKLASERKLDKRYESETTYSRGRDKQSDTMGLLAMVAAANPGMNPEQWLIDRGQLSGTTSSQIAGKKLGKALTPSVTKQLNKVLTGSTGSGGTSKWNRGVTPGGQSVGIFGMPTGIIKDPKKKGWFS